MARKPQQRRSRATVDAIVEAGFIAVSRVGVHAVTTRQIAEIAGIGVGSLYEYFANKEAVFEEMRRRFLNETATMLRDQFPTLVRMPIDQFIYTTLMTFREFLMKNDERYLEFARTGILVEFHKHLDIVSKALTEMLMQYLMHNPEGLRIPNVPAMSYILINGGIFMVVRHLSDPNPPMSYEELARALADSVGGYVKHELRKQGNPR